MREGSVEYYRAAWEDQANFPLTQLEHSVPPPPDFDKSFLLQ